MQIVRYALFVPYGIRIVEWSSTTPDVWNYSLDRGLSLTKADTNSRYVYFAKKCDRDYVKLMIESWHEKTHNI